MAKGRAYDNLCARLEKKKVRSSCTDRLGRETERVKMYCTYVKVIKDGCSNVVVSSVAGFKRWKEYFEKLMNKENDRETRTEKAEVVNEEVNCFSREEVKKTLRRIKKGKAVGPDELPVEIWKCMGDIGIK